MDLDRIAADFHRDGFISPIPLLSRAEAAEHRDHLERAESEVGPLHYRYKAHLFLTSPWALATNPALLDLVEAILGPDLLLYGTAYIVKEPQTAAQVSWHQDLTYWGFENDQLVNVWLALSPATEESGCMMMVPGSHKDGQRHHEPTDDADNILDLGQTVTGVEPAEARLCPLQPGELSIHHGWTLHSSRPNRSSDRRIGMNIQYIAPSNRQTINPGDTAILVRGEDAYGLYRADTPATVDLDPDGLARQAEADADLATTYTTSLNASPHHSTAKDHRAP